MLNPIRLFVTVFATFLALVAINAAFGASDPDSYSIPDNGGATRAERAQHARSVAFGVGMVSLFLFGLAFCVDRPKRAQKDKSDSEFESVSPVSLALSGDPMGRFVVSKWKIIPLCYPPALCARFGAGCWAGLLTFTTIITTTLWLWPLDPFLYAFFALVILLWLRIAMLMLPGMLAARRLNIGISHLTPKVQPGESVFVTFEVSSPVGVTIPYLKVVLAALETVGTHRHSQCRIIGRTESVVELLVELQPGQTRSFNASLHVPSNAKLTSTDGDRNIRWVAGVVAELPFSPDYEVSRELIIESDSGTPAVYSGS